jgi:hypothetical protein
MNFRRACSVPFLFLYVLGLAHAEEPDLPLLDLSGATERQVVIAPGTTEAKKGVKHLK